MDIYQFANLAILTSVAALLILAIKFIVKEKMSPRVHVLIWSILLLQLILFPMRDALPQSNFALQKYIPAYEAQIYTEQTGIPSERAGKPDEQKSANIDKSETAMSAAVDKDANVQVGLNAQTGEAAQAGFNVQTGEGISNNSEQAKAANSKLASILLFLSFGISIFFFLFSIVKHKMYIRRYRNLPLCRDIETLRLLEECKAKLRIKKKIALYVGADCTMLTGVIRPAIYISGGYSREELRHVFMHELCHDKNYDICLNVVSTAILCLFWFNPLIWLCFYVFRRDIEIYCDDRAIRITGEKKEYAAVLLKTAIAEKPFVLATSLLISGEKEVAQRIRFIAAFKKPKIWITGLVAVIAVVMAASLLANVDKGVKTVTYASEGTLSTVVFDVPADWIEGMKTDDGGNLIFLGGQAGTAYIPMIKEHVNAIAAVQSVGHGSADGSKGIEEQMSDYLVREGLPGLVKEVSTIQRIDWAATGENDAEGIGASGVINYPNVVGAYVAATTEQDGKVYNWVIGIGEQMYCLWGDADKLSHKELLTIVKSMRYGKNPDDGLITMQESANSAYYLDQLEDEVDDSAKKVFENYLQGYEKMNLPVNQSIKGYQVNAFTPVAIEADTPLAEIYPNAVIYKVDYEIYAEYGEFYDDYHRDQAAESEFEILAGGGKRYKERYLAFVENTYIAADKKIADTHKFYFVGFLSDNDITVHGAVKTAYQQIERWYSIEIEPSIYKHMATKYIGDHNAVGRIVNALPMQSLIDTTRGTFTSERDQTGIVLQTAERPYGLIINYHMVKPSDETDDRCMKNARILSTAIGNIEKCRINLHYANGERSRVIEFPLTAEGSVDMPAL